MGGESVVIVGAGQAGMQIAITLRDEGFRGEVTLIGAEPHSPYQRPPLSKAYLAGTADVESLELRTEQFYLEHEIRLVPGERIVDAQVTSEGGVVKGASGTEYPFSQLAITTGANARPMSIEGASLPGVFTLRNLGDADALKSRFGTIHRLVIIGAGFIGLEAAAVATAAGKDVTVVHSGNRLMSRSVAPEISEFYRHAHERRGTQIRLGCPVNRLVGDDEGVSGVELSDGEVIPADAVIIGIGVSRDTSAFSGLDLALDGDAIIVDRFARTSHPRVVAAGDAVAIAHPAGHDALVRLESVQSAIDQATVAAHTLMGKPEPYNAVPRFWSDQADLKLQMAGLFHTYDQMVLRGNLENEQFSALYYRNGILIAIHSVNDPSSHMAGRRALSAGDNIPAERASDLSTPLKLLIESQKG